MTSRSRARTPAGHARRTKPVRRASARLSPIRAGAALAMLASAAAIYGVAASPAFEFAALDVAGIQYTDEAAVLERLELPAGTNLFQLATEPLEARLVELPTVRSAAVSVRLPGTLVVAIEERRPLLVWQVAGSRFLVDADGSLFASLPTRPGAEASSLTVVDDQRADDAGYTVGRRLDPVDLDAATRLGSLTPIDLGSGAVSLSVELTDTYGFVVRAVPTGWSAIFGFYTPSLRTTEIIPGQVRLLRSLLLEQGERNVQSVVLASVTDGAFTTPAPSVAPPPPAAPSVGP